jgi:hypothetical protein
MSAPRRWPLFLIAAPAAVAVWSGWVGLGGLCGFGVVHPLPGIAPGFQLNTAITLPVGVEAYGAYGLGAWLHPGLPESARKFAKFSAIGALLVGMVGQVAFHLLSAADATKAPWPVVVGVSCLPVVVLGLGAGLAHLLRSEGVPAQTAASAAVRAKERVSRSSEGSGTSEESNASEAASGPRPNTCSCAKWMTNPEVHAILAEMPRISGAALGRKIGVSERHGQRILRALAAA